MDVSDATEPLALVDEMAAIFWTLCFPFCNDTGKRAA